MQTKHSIGAFNKVLLSLYEGPLSATPIWQECLEEIRSFFMANLAVLIFRPSPSDPISRAAYSGGIPGMDRSYANSFYALDPFVDLPLDKVFTTERFMEENKWVNNPFYRNFLAPADVYRMMGADMRTSDGIDCRIRICRPKDAPNFSSADKEYCKLLIPHLERCVQLHSNQHAVHATTRLFAAAIDRLMFGTIILDQYGAVMHTNHNADEILARKDGLFISAGKLKAVSTRDNTVLQDLLAKTLVSRSNTQSNELEVLSISRPKSKCPLGMMIRSLSSEAWAESMRYASVAILLRDPLQSASTSEIAMRRIFGFSPAETALALLLADGLTLEQSAEMLHVTRNTVRTQLKSIFSKTATTRQTDLVRVILGSIAVLC